MPYKRLWIKDLPIQEVSRRLKGGENVYHDQDEGFIAIVDGKIEIKAGRSAEFDIVGIWKEEGEKENV